MMFEKLSEPILSIPKLFYVYVSRYRNYLEAPHRQYLAAAQRAVQTKSRRTQISDGTFPIIIYIIKFQMGIEVANSLLVFELHLPCFLNSRLLCINYGLEGKYSEFATS